MSFNHRVRIVAPFAVAALALGMTACAPGADAEPTPSVVTVTESAAESPSMEPTSSEPTSETSEPADETSAPVVTETPEPTAGPNDESGVVDVTVAGDQGILALQHAGTVPVGTAGPTNQRLITGPGECFALTNEGKPQLIVFPADATFVLQEGKPSATFAGTEHLVGRQFSVATTLVPKTSVTGIPDRCMQGSDEMVLVVN